MSPSLCIYSCFLVCTLYAPLVHNILQCTSMHIFSPYINSTYIYICMYVCICTLHRLLPSGKAAKLCYIHALLAYSVLWYLYGILGVVSTSDCVFLSINLCTMAACTLQEDHILVSIYQSTCLYPHDTHIRIPIYTRIYTYI